MTKLHLIAGISPSLQRLLEYSGIDSIEALAGQDPTVLARQLASLKRKSSGRVAVTKDDIRRLVVLARKLVDDPSVDRRSPSDRASGAETGAVNLDRVPEAIAVEPGRPSAPAAAVPPRMPPPPADTTRGAKSEPPPKVAAMPKFRDFQAYNEGRTGVEPLPRKAADDEEEVDNSLKKSKYKPGAPVPRLVRRGVPYPRPYFLVICSLIVLATRLLMLAVIIGTPIVLWPAFMRGDQTHLMTFFWVIGAWMVFGVLYFLFALRARCRVCTNPFFWSKRCFKNSKAHRLFGLGLVGSLALHALLFGWFRCMYCGTAIRIKFVDDPERSR